MGASSYLYLKRGIRLRDVIDVMKNRLELDVKARGYGEDGGGDIDLKLEGEARCINYYFDADEGALGLWSGANDKGVMARLFKSIAAVLGGKVKANDCDDKAAESFGDGMVGQRDGLGFFVKAAILNGFMANEDDLKGLLCYMADWDVRVNGSKSPLAQVRAIRDLDFVQQARKEAQDRQAAESAARFKADERRRKRLAEKKVVA